MCKQSVCLYIQIGVLQDFPSLTKMSCLWILRGFPICMLPTGEMLLYAVYDCMIWPGVLLLHAWVVSRQSPAIGFYGLCQKPKVESRNPPDPGWEHAWKQNYQDDDVMSSLFRWITFFPFQFAMVWELRPYLEEFLTTAALPKIVFLLQFYWTSLFSLIKLFPSLE